MDHWVNALDNKWNMEFIRNIYLSVATIYRQFDLEFNFRSDFK
jgi:hypothetical protein